LECEKVDADSNTNMECIGTVYAHGMSYVPQALKDLWSNSKAVNKLPRYDN